MTILKRTEVIGYDSNGVCKECNKIGETTRGNCYACEAELCYGKCLGTGSCNLRKKRAIGEMYLPCLKEPICKAILDGDVNWRYVKPLDEVPYNGIVGK